MALFPRKIDGQYVALCRFDADSNYVMASDNVRIWNNAATIESPTSHGSYPASGNGGSPVETEAGWLVITHGVRPFRTYSLGAILLDVDDPRRVIGRLHEPLLTPLESEREGYVPNVVYSCGNMIHGDDLVLPYGMSDTECRIARVPLAPLLALDLPVNCKVYHWCDRQTTQEENGPNGNDSTRQTRAGPLRAWRRGREWRSATACGIPSWAGRHRALLDCDAR
jgi:hypothetical protein